MSRTLQGWGERLKKRLDTKEKEAYWKELHCRLAPAPNTARANNTIISKNNKGKF